MRILFATSHPHLPQIAGGLQANTDEMANHLIKRGHDVSLLCGLTGDGLLGLRHRIALKLSRQPVVHDMSLGYSVFRAWFPWMSAVVEEVVRRARPTIMVAQGGKAALLVQAFARLRVPGVLYFHLVEFDDLGCPLSALSTETLFISNSNFTKSRIFDTFGIDSTVIFPLIEKKKYAVEPSRAAVVFVNPHPNKGVDIACSIAKRCNDIPFLFVESWTLAPHVKQRLQRLPNVTYLQRTSDMRSVYARARFILAPSIWEEAFGRVVAEGHISGLPAVASDIGGLPESTGPGGLLVDPHGPIDPWVDAVRRLWDDRDVYESYARAALNYSKRAELDIAAQIHAFQAVLISGGCGGSHSAGRTFETAAEEDASSSISRALRPS